MSIHKILDTSLREKGFTDDQISTIQDIIRDVHVVPYDRLAEAVAKRRELERSAQEYQSGHDQLRAELDAANAELTSLRSELKAANVKHAVETVLMKAGARNPSFVMRGLDLGKVQISSDGSVSGLDDQIEALRKTDGYLFVSESAPVPTSPVPESMGRADANQVRIHGLEPAAPHAPAPVKPDEPVTTMDALYSLATHRQYGRY